MLSILARAKEWSIRKNERKNIFPYSGTSKSVLSFLKVSNGMNGVSEIAIYVPKPYFYEHVEL